MRYHVCEENQALLASFFKIAFFIAISMFNFVINDIDVVRKVIKVNKFVHVVFKGPLLL